MPKLPWPLPAFAGWSIGWATFALALFGGLAPAVAFGTGGCAGAVPALAWATRWRRVLIAAGFPLSALASGAVALPAWSCLAALALLALLYPRRAWRDAPVFPTPPGALDGLAALAPLPAGARVLDAGCGAGDGLRALRQAYPDATVEGIEWSWPLVLLSRLRCRFARVRRGDLWADDWSDCDLVYLYQRPESMARALDKARREQRPGSWLASLEFAVPGVRPTRVLDAAGTKRVWLYRVPPRARR